MPTNRCENCYEYGQTVPVPHPDDPSKEIRLCADCDQERSRKVRRIGAPNSPARWLSENIRMIPNGHGYALMRMDQGAPTLVVSGTKATCTREMNDQMCEVVCELSKYRTGGTNATAAE